MVFLGEGRSVPLSEAGGFTTEIDSDIKDTPGDDLDELGLGTGELVVQSAECAPR